MASLQASRSARRWFMVDLIRPLPTSERRLSEPCRSGVSSGLFVTKIFLLGFCPTDLISIGAALAGHSQVAQHNLPPQSAAFDLLNKGRLGGDYRCQGPIFMPLRPLGHCAASVKEGSLETFAARFANDCYRGVCCKYHDIGNKRSSRRGRVGG